jgi:excisionase family DNA binding protein
MAQNLVVMPQDELVKLLRQAVRDELDNKPASTTKNWLTSSEIAKHFDVAESTVKNWIREGGCPHYDVGGIRRFELSAVDRWFRNRMERKLSRVK